MSSLHAYAYDPPTTTLTSLASVDFDGALAPCVFGVCGIATADIATESPPGGDDGIEDELIVTSLDGDLMIYNLAWQSEQLVIGPLRHHSIHDGALGANNAILVDTVTEPKALFVAGSAGMRKFTVVSEE